MTNAIRLVTAGLVAAVMTVLGAAPSQAADYTDVSITITLSGDRLIGGTSFDYDVEAPVECDWSIEYEGAQQSGSGTSTSGTFDTRKVSSETPTTINATCSYDDSSALGSGSAQVSAAATASASAVVTLLPLGASTDVATDGSLPGTGGSSLWIVVAAVALLVVGGGALVVARRRH